MSLYEIISMFRALEKRRKASSAKPQVSDDDWQRAQDLLQSVTQHDPSVRIH